MSLIVFFIFTIFYSSLSNSSSVIDNIKVIDVRIYDGDETDISSVPFTVFIKIRQRQRGVNVCGGVILDNATVLTAAHCFENSMGVQVIAGSSNPSIDKNGQRRVASEIVIHPDYSYDVRKNTTVFDFAIVKLRTPLKFDVNVKPAVLAKNDGVSYVGDMGKVCGWGSTNEAPIISPTLLCTSTHILTNTYCDSLQRKIELSPHVICSGRSSCQGDSGSGLIFDDTVIGIVSFTLGPCNYAVPPVVYGKTSSILDFIRNNTINNDEKILDIPKDDKIFFPETF